MASLEKRGNQYRAVFWFRGERFSRSLKTSSQREALARLARLDDNLRRFELGLLTSPDDVDFATFLISDGRVATRPALQAFRTLGQLLGAYFKSLPAGSIEASTIAGMHTHASHLRRILGANFQMQALALGDLQSYIATRARDPGLRGRTVSPATIKKDIVTLRTVWNWAVHMGHLTRPFPSRGLKFPKLEEKPPFQTFAEITRRIERSGLAEAEKADLWDCAFLTLEDLAELLAHVKQLRRQPFVYPLFLFAAHTGARRSELLRCRIDDVDFRSGTVSIREKKRVRHKVSRRRVPLSPMLIEELKIWLNDHPGGHHVFCQSADVARSKTVRHLPTPITTDEAHDHFRRALAGSKWASLRGWHVFRHSFCSNCAARGVDQRLINAWVGHQTEEMVNRYRHQIPSVEQQALATVFS
jgi:integrase